MSIMAVAVEHDLVRSRRGGVDWRPKGGRTGCIPVTSSATCSKVVIGVNWNTAA